MSKKNEYHDHLRQVPLFSGLNDRELDAVGRAATELDYPAGKTLIREGQLAHEMFVVMSGTCEVTREGEHIADIGPGDLVGELAVLAHSHRHGTVTATSDTRLLHLDGRAVSSMLEEAPEIAVKMLPIVAARAIDNSEH